MPNAVFLNHHFNRRRFRSAEFWKRPQVMLYARPTGDRRCWRGAGRLILDAIHRVELIGQLPLELEVNQNQFQQQRTPGRRADSAIEV